MSKHGAKRKVVRVGGGAKNRKLWAFGYAEIARACGISENAVRLSVARGQIDPADLATVAEFIHARRRS